MKTKSETKQIGRERRHNRIRAKVAGTGERPRLSVYKSNRYLHAQLIDDGAAKTLVAGSTKEQPKDPAEKQALSGARKKTAGASWLGREIAKRAKEHGITTAVFDRGGFRYTGRIAALAEAAREGGLKF